MHRKKVAIILDKQPNFDDVAFIYFLLSTNKIQNTFEFIFPGATFSFPSGVSNFKELLRKLNELADEYGGYSTKAPDFWITITSKSLFHDWFFARSGNCSIITTDVWDKAFSPPSLFEYLLHCITACLLFMNRELNFKPHDDTRGCVIDFTRIKAHDRIDIALGYLCEECKKTLKSKVSEEYLKSINNLICFNWIGNLNKEGSVAYNLKHYFNFNVHRDSGFNKGFWEKTRSKFVELPFEMIKAFFVAFLTFLMTVYLFILGFR